MLEPNQPNTVAQHESGQAAEAKGHGYNIFVNTRKKEWNGDSISYDQVVRLGFPSDPNPNTIYEVTYKNGPKENREGTMVRGDSVTVKSGMHFVAHATGQS